MKKKVILIIIIIFIMTLSACQSNKYTDTGHTLNGHKVYLYDSKQKLCPSWYSMGVDIGDGVIYNIVNECPLSRHVFVEDKYVPLIDYLRNNLINKSELEDLNHGFFTISTSISNILEIDLNEYVLDSIIVKELNNEIMTPPQWDTFEEIDLEMNHISNDLLNILNQALNQEEICRDSMCRLLYAQGPINIKFVNANRSILIELYEDRLNLHMFLNDVFDSVIYNLSEPLNNIHGLYTTIYNRYLQINE